MEEIEVKYLEIDPTVLEEKLRSIGAEFVREFAYRRRVFDYADLRLDNDGAWLRVRTDGQETTMGYKRRLGSKGNSGKDEGMEEIETVVDDFDNACLIIERLGLVEKFYVENNRRRWKRGVVEFDIDTWPALEPYLEIEGPSMEALDAAAQELGFDLADKKVFSTTQIYELKGIRDKDYQRMTFKELIKK